MKIKIKKPKIKLSAPKITAPKVIKDVAKAAEKTVSSAAKGAGKLASETTKTLGKGTEGLVANTADIGSALAKGDFKGIGKEALELVQTGKDIGKGLTSANIGAVGSAVGTVGAGLGDKNIQKAATNIEREGRKGVSQYGDLAMDVGANALTAGGYGAAKSGLMGLSQGGLGSLVSSQGLQNLAVQGLASQAGIDPNMLQAGLAASKGDLKGAALSGLGSYAGLSPDQLKMAQTGLSAATGDKSGLASGLASQFGAGDDLSGMLGSLAGGKDLKSAALSKLGSMAGLDSKLLENVSKGKIDPMQLAGLAGFDSKSLLGGAADKLGISSFTNSPEAQEMINMGKSAGRIVQSADAYAKDAENAALDMQSKAQNAYKIAKGDSFNAIAKKLGVTPEQLRAANPQIKDINKIAAGANLNIPQTIQDLSGEIPQGVVESGQMTQAEFDAARKEKPGLWENIKTGVSSAVGGAKDFVAENKGLLGIGAQAGAAGLGYMASKEAMEAQQKLLKDQLSQEQAMGKELMGQKFDPNRYAKEQDFLTKRIEGQGRTALTRQMEQESIQKAARTAAAGRMAGLEQQARLGGAALGTAGLAASLAGAQSGQNIMAEDMRARDVQAEQNLEKAIARTGALSTQQTQEEAQLAQQKFGVESGRAAAAGATRSQLSQIEQNRADALGRLYTSGADLIQKGLSGMKTPEEQAQEQRQQQMEAESKLLDLEKKRREVYGATPQQTPPPPAAKVDGARRVSQGSTNQQPKPAPAPTAKDQFNQQNMPQPGAGQGYGVLAPVTQKIQQGQQAVQKVQSTVDEAKKKAEEFKKDPLGSFGIKF